MNSDLQQQNHGQGQEGFILTSHSQDRRHSCELILWITSPQGPAKLVISQHKPLFFSLSTHHSAIHQQLSQHHISVEIKSLNLQTFQHQAVIGLYFNTMRDFYRAKKILESAQLPLFESDFRPQERFLMERFIRGSLNFIGRPHNRKQFIEYQQVKIRPSQYQPQLNLLSIDIECSIKGQLYSIGLYGKKNHCDYQKVIMIGPPQVGEQSISNLIEWVEDELQLLTIFQHNLLDYDPDIIIGWNLINFDLRTLVERSKQYQFQLRIGRGGGIANCRDSANHVHQSFIDIPGRVAIDGIEALKTATYSYSSFSLEHVAQQLLGRGKLHDDGHYGVEHIQQDFIHNKVKLAAYNLNDCVLVWDIFQQTQVLQFLILRRQLTGLALNRQGGSVAAFTNLYLPKLHRAGYIAPNLPINGGLTSPGGYVMNSKPGLYDDVLVLDFKSLYPSIIRTFCIDPLGLIKGLAAPEQAIPGFKQAYFSRKQHFLPQIIDELWKQRDQAKQQRNASRSQAIKLLMNSFYGVLGSGGCRFYDPRLASSITLRGHEIMQTTADWVKEQGYTVIYGDTDSIFVWLNQVVTDSQATAIGETLATDINQKWKHKLAQELQLDCYLEIEFETHFKRFLMPTIRGSALGSKKRYAGLITTDEGDRLLFKGLEHVRTDWTDLARQFQAALYKCIFQQQDPLHIIQKIVADTRSGKNDQQLIYRKRLRRRLNQYVKNVPPHVKAARLADEYHRRQGLPLRYQHHGTIAYVITLNGPEPLECQTAPLDHQHYIDKQLKPVADAILPFIGLQFDQLINQQRQLF